MAEILRQRQLGRRTAAAFIIRAIRRRRPTADVPERRRSTTASISTSSAPRRRPTGWSMRRPPIPSSAITRRSATTGDWLVISTSLAGDENDVHVIDLRKPTAEAARRFHRAQEPVEFRRQRGQPLLFLDRQGCAAASAWSRSTSARAGACPGRRSFPERRTRSTASSLDRRQADRQLSGRREERGAGLRPRRQAAVDDRACPASARSAASAARHPIPETFFCVHQLQPADDRSIAMMRRPARRATGLQPKVTFDPDTITRRAALLRVEGRHAGADVHRPHARTTTGPGADAALRLWRLQHFDDTRLLGDADRVARAGRGLCRRQHSRRRRIWQGLARWRAARQQAERVRRFHRRRRISEGAGHHVAARPRDQRRLERRLADRRGGQPAAGSVRRRAARRSA